MATATVTTSAASRFTPRAIIATNASEARIAAAAYHSPGCTTDGTSRQSRSRTRPPPVAVRTPSRTAAENVRSISRARSAPSSTHTPISSVSTTPITGRAARTPRAKTMPTTEASAAMERYSGLRSASGTPLCSSTSRMRPPPTAQHSAMTNTPTGSSPRRVACNEPDRAPKVTAVISTAYGSAMTS